MYEARQPAQPPFGLPHHFEKQSIQERKYPAVNNVEQHTIELGPVPMGGKHGTEHKGKVHTSEAKGLAAPHQHAEEGGGDKSPKDDARPVHHIISSSACWMIIPICFLPTSVLSFLSSLRVSVVVHRSNPIL
jgi:hypothetical protein